MRRNLFLFFVFIILSTPVWANDFGIAMHGKPLLKAGDSFSYANVSAPQGGTLKQSVVGSFDTINPFTLKGKAAQGLNLFYDRLTIRSWDEPFTLYPLIAEHIEIPDDRSSITFTLNKKARFNDGSPITSDDVLFTYALLKEKGRPNMRTVYKLIKRAEIKDKQTITFYFGEGYNRETAMIVAMMPVLSKRYWSTKNFDQTSFEIPVSSGPYLIDSIDEGRQIIFEKNKNYWAKDLPILRGLYNFESISFDYFRDDSVAFEAFKSGDIDIRNEIDPAQWQSSYDGARVASGQIQKYEIPHGRVERMWGFIFNTRHAPFDNVNVRKALSLALDRPWLNRNLFHGQYKLTNSFFANSDLAYTPPATKILTMRQNLIQADQLLKSENYIIQNGKRIHKDTKVPLRFEILIGSPEDEKIALAYKRTLAKLGVVASLRSLDSTSFRDRMIRYNYDMLLYFWQNSLSPGTEQALNFSCAAAKEEGRFNYSGICSEDIDALVYALPDVKTRDELIEHAKELDKQLLESYIAIPLFHAGFDRIAADKRIGFPKRPALYGTVLESLWDKSLGLPQKTD